MNIQKKLDTLFNQWKDTHDIYINETDLSELPELTNFTMDGISGKDETAYVNADIKVLYVLVESNVGKDCKHFRINDYFWFREQVVNNGKHIIPARIQFVQENITGRPADLNAVAYMNLNKCGGGCSRNFKKLRNYVRLPKIKEHIKEEIEILEPDLIVCFGKGVDDLVKEILGETHALYKKILPLRHPSCRNSSDDYEIMFQERWSQIICKEK